MTIDSRFQLTPRQAAALAWRLLLPVDKPMTWQQIARRLNTTEEQAKIAYSVGCSKIRSYAGSHYPIGMLPVECDE